MGGKSTTMEMLAEKLKKKGYNVIIQKENVRPYLDKIGKTIDEIRKDPVEYMRMQEYIINERRERDMASCYNDSENNVYLIDRTFADTLFYIEEYIDKSRFTEDELNEYIKMHDETMKTCEQLYCSGYDLVLEFIPIDFSGYNKNGDDPYRPKNVGVMNNYESACIGNINRAMVYKGQQARFGGDFLTFKTIDYNDKSYTNEKCVDEIMDQISMISKLKNA